MIEKLATGILGFDQISEGGIPAGRTSLVCGSAGSAKTVFAAQFLAEAIARGHGSGVFVTFEEHPDDIRQNMAGLGWDIPKWEKEGLWAFVDASPDPDLDQVEAGMFDLGALMARVEHAIQSVRATRVSMDSLGAIFSQYTDSSTVRRELFRISCALRQLEVTAVMTAERVEEYGEISRFGIEEFVVDNVIILRNVLEAGTRRRTIEILKYRGTTHRKGEYPFTIVPTVGSCACPFRPWSSNSVPRTCAFVRGSMTSIACAVAVSFAIRSSCSRERPEQVKR